MKKENKKLAQEKRAKERKQQALKNTFNKVCKIGLPIVVFAALVVILITNPFASKDKNLTYYADIDIKDYGKITVKLDQEAAPITVDNFVNLAQKGFYDGLTFHRIIEGFMMQGGAGDSTKNIVGEFSANGYKNELSHTRGAISMARTNDMNSANSQFFIVHEDSPHLDGQYAAFGYVTEGIEVVDKVCEQAKPTDNNGTIKEEQQPIITSIKIRTE